MFSLVWGVMAPMGRLVMCLGRLGRQNRPKSVPKASLLLYLLACVFEGRVFFDICGFLEGPTLDPLAQAQSKRIFPFSAWPLKGYRFYSNCWNISGTVGVGIPKNALQNRV